MYDAVVVGLGGMGSAALAHLASRGARVVGIEQFEPGHAFGSSHGESRIIRLAYYEHPSYVPLLKEAFRRWRELELEWGYPLLHQTGSLDASEADGHLFRDSLHSCRLHDLGHEVLDSKQLSARFPAFSLPPGHRAVFQPDGGILEPEQCIRAYVSLAARAGAQVVLGVRALGWRAGDGAVSVDIGGRTLRGKRLILTAGAWTGKVAPELKALVTPERQVVAWLATERLEQFAPARFPVFNVAVPEGRYYGFPNFGNRGAKIGRYHHRGETADPDGLDRVVSEEDIAVLRSFTERYLKGAPSSVTRTDVCMFENSPDEHFLIGPHPLHGNVLVAAGFSGHGFKFCSVIGPILADLVLQGGTAHDIGFLDLQRFRAALSAPSSPSGGAVT